MKKEKKKLSSSGQTTREKMLARKKKLAEKGSGNGFVFPGNGTTRVRIVSAGTWNRSYPILPRRSFNHFSSFI